MSEPEIPEVKEPARDALPAAIRAEMRNVPETRVSPRSEFELREIPNGTGGTNLRFTGFACVTDAEYEMEDFIGPWIESVSVGAFKKTLAEGADAAFLLNHEGMTLARTKPGTLKLSEQTDPTISPIDGITGLYSEAMLDPQNMYVQAMRSAVERGDLDEMSFAFRVLRQEWNEDWTRRWINEVSVDKGDVSLVNYGANPTTGGTVALRQRLFGRDGTPPPTERLMMVALRARGMTLEAFVGALKDVRAGATLSQATLDVLQPILDDLAAIDKLVDADQPVLAELLGVPNPDDDEEDEAAEQEQEAAETLADEGRSLLFLPDHSTEARAKLAAMRR